MPDDSKYFFYVINVCKHVDIKKNQHLKPCKKLVYREHYSTSRNRHITNCGS